MPAPSSYSTSSDSPARTPSWSIAFSCLRTDASSGCERQPRGSLSHEPHEACQRSDRRPEATERGINVGMGVDTMGDIIAEMHQEVLIQSLATGDPGAIDPVTALEMATRNGAAALGLADELGSIEEGKRADLGCVDLRAHPSAASPRSDLDAGESRPGTRCRARRYRWPPCRTCWSCRGRNDLAVTHGRGRYRCIRVPPQDRHGVTSIAIRIVSCGAGQRLAFPCLLRAANDRTDQEGPSGRIQWCRSARPLYHPLGSRT